MTRRFFALPRKRLRSGQTSKALNLPIRPQVRSSCLPQLRFFICGMTSVGQGVTRAVLCTLVFFFLVRPAGCFDGREWQFFERRARDGAMTVEEGRAAIKEWAKLLEDAYPPGEFSADVRFPLKGYALDAVGGKNGEGYRPAGYKFLSGNRHKGHPAQDIFVNDRNQDALDDRSGRAVEVAALADGIVVSTFFEWTADGACRHIRGGNYIWVYHPALKAFSYYAHLQEIRVLPGDRVAGGRAIATLGRTGTNARPPRSPTHLHLMLLNADDMTPVDPYPLLKKAR
jgi:murein DD-endopeptidase MepM/ murein hydrolase activator NlpD